MRRDVARGFSGVASLREPVYILAIGRKPPTSERSVEVVFSWIEVFFDAARSKEKYPILNTLRDTGKSLGRHDVRRPMASGRRVSTKQSV